jgi:hypothetical protein
MSRSRARFKGAWAVTGRNNSDPSRPQLLDTLQPYDKALRKITGKAHDEIALHKYRKDSSTGPDESMTICPRMQTHFGYDVGHVFLILGNRPDTVYLMM